MSVLSYAGQLPERLNTKAAERIAQPIRAPPTRTGQVLPHAFTHMIDVRHVQVEAGMHTVAACGDQCQTGNQLAPQARFHTIAFEKCPTLQKFN